MSKARKQRLLQNVSDKKHYL